MLIALFAIPLSTAIRFLLFAPRLQLILPIIAQSFRCIAILLHRQFLISWPQVECDSAPTLVNPISASVQSNGKEKKAYSGFAASQLFCYEIQGKIRGR